jgi:hypothetical protein
LYDAFLLIGLIGLPLTLVQPLKLGQDPSSVWILVVEAVGLALAGVVTVYLFFQMPAKGGRRYTLHFLAAFVTLVIIVSVPEYWAILLLAVLGYLGVGLYLGRQWRRIVGSAEG